MYFSMDVVSIYDADSCEHILRIIEWIKECVAKTEIPCPVYSFNIRFSKGNLSCTIDNETDFIKHALGQEISVLICTLTAYYNNKRLTFYIGSKSSFDKKVAVECDDTTLLERVVAALDAGRKAYDAEKLQAKNSIVINADNNSGAITIGDHNTTTVTSPIKETPPKKSCIQEIFGIIKSKSVWVIFVVF